VLLAQGAFTPIYRDWLRVRDQELTSRLGALEVPSERRILIINGNKGPQLFPSVVDFFSVLQKACPRLQVTSASYFDDIQEFHRGAARKGLTVVSVGDVLAASAEELNQFHTVITIGVSQALAELMKKPGVEARLVALDLGFYHQLIEAPGSTFKNQQDMPAEKAAQKNRVRCYSCQTQSKIEGDLWRLFAMPLFEWHWFNYIPIGFRYTTYYQSDKQIFDIALLGTAGRDYSQFDANLFQGKRVLFMGDPGGAAEIGRMQSQLDLTVVSGVDGDTYRRLLALCRCIALPFLGENVLLSVVDALASGTALVTPRHPGAARLEAERAPIAFYGPAAGISAKIAQADLAKVDALARHQRAVDLHAHVEALLNAPDRLLELRKEAIAFSKAHLDIYGILERILREQVLT
jgi:hypothetical protein